MRVWTHRGRLRTVVELQQRPHVGRLLGLSSQGRDSVVWCTPEQRFLLPNSPLAGRGKSGDIHRRLGGFNPALIGLGRQLRSNSTTAEGLLWERLPGRRLCDAKFRRQHSLGAHYIVDFYCAEACLAVELDGGVHDSSRAHWADGIRHRQVQQAAVRLLRFRNERILEDLDRVLEEIAEHLVPTTQHETRNGEELKEATETWAIVDKLKVGSEIVLDESGKIGIIELVETRFVNETVYDLTVEEDHSFVTEAGVVNNL